MPSGRSRAKAVKEGSVVTPQAYAEFIGQIELETVWLKSAELQNRHGPEKPDDASLVITGSARWEPRPRGFCAFHAWEVRVESEGKPAVEIDVVFGLGFVSPQPLTEPLWSVFSEHNLPVNTWPYLREFVSTTLGRMNWSPYTLPALKRGVGSSRDAKPREGDEPPPIEQPD